MKKTRREFLREVGVSLAGAIIPVGLLSSGALSPAPPAVPIKHVMLSPSTGKAVIFTTTYAGQTTLWSKNRDKHQWEEDTYE